MRWDWLRRICTAVYAVWFVIAVAEPVSLHACPMHGSNGQHGHMHHMPGDQMSDGAMLLDASLQCGAPHQGDSHSHQTQHHCTCLGTCCAMAVAFTHATGVAMIPARLVLRPAAPLLTWRTPLRTAAPHLLPFATAPPRV